MALVALGLAPPLPGGEDGALWAAHLTRLDGRRGEPRSGCMLELTQPDTVSVSSWAKTDAGVEHGGTFQCKKNYDAQTFIQYQFAIV
jgi:hypothetical protein